MILKILLYALLLSVAGGAFYQTYKDLTGK